VRPPPPCHYGPLGLDGTTRWLVRFGYDGSGFSGWARQPTGRTIEGVLRQGLKGRSIAAGSAGARLEVASRTDRGVSARANALVLSSELSAPSLLRRLNSIAPGLFFTACTEVPAEFRVRGARRRVYRYFEFGGEGRSARAEAALPLFRGRIDVRSFGRGLDAGRPCWRDLESVTREPHDQGSVLDVRAPSFVWGEVRKIVGALREVEAGRLSLTRLEAALQGRLRLTLPMAEPQGLVLWEVELPVVWETRWAGPNRLQQAFGRALAVDIFRRGALLETVQALTDVDRPDTLAAP
jgi:tRNA pseudouridine38-40 synthase